MASKKKAASKKGKRSAAKKKSAPKRTAKKSAPKRVAKKSAPKRAATKQKSPPRATESMETTQPAEIVDLQGQANLMSRHAPVDDFTSSGDELVDIFQRYDRDRTGFIERNEFARLLEALGQDTEEEMLAVALDVVDSERTGKVSFQNFKRWWTAR